MRLIVPLALFLLGLGLLAAKLPSPTPPVNKNAARAAKVDDWRRTADGWERMRDWRPAFEERHPPLHPAVVVALQILLVLTAMLTFSSVPRRAKRPSRSADRDLRSSRASR